MAIAVLPGPAFSHGSDGAGQDSEGELLMCMRSATEPHMQKAQTAMAKSMKEAFEMIVLSCAQICAQTLRNQREELMQEQLRLEEQLLQASALQTPRSSTTADCEQSPKNELFLSPTNLTAGDWSALDVAFPGRQETSLSADSDSNFRDPQLAHFLQECKLKGLNGTSAGHDQLSTNWNCLHHAVIANRPDITKSLCENPGFYVLNAVTSNGSTALLGACHHGHEENVRLLLGCDRYAAINVPVEKGVSPITIAIQKGDSHIVELLMADSRVDVKGAHTPMGGTILHVAMSQTDVATARLVLDHPDINVNACNKIGQTALHCALTKDMAQMVLNCPRFKAANAKDSSGKTALHSAAMHNKPGVVQALLESGHFTAVNVADTSGMTALHFAVMKGNSKVVEVFVNSLLNHCNPSTLSVDLTRPDNKGRSALDMAKEKGHTSVVQLLSIKKLATRDEPKLWKVVGGADNGGIIVRIDADLTSEAFPERLGIGGTVEEIEKRGNRLHFRLVHGTGPTTGWVNCQIHDTELMIKI